MLIEATIVLEREFHSCLQAGVGWAVLPYYFRVFVDQRAGHWYKPAEKFMSKQETPFRAGLARSIRDHLRAAGSWPSRFSREIGHSDSWLADKLNPNRSATLTIPNIEEVAAYTEVDAQTIVADAFPTHFDISDARALILALSEEYENRTGQNITKVDVSSASQRLSPSTRDTLLRILSKRPNVKKLEPGIDVGLLEEIQNAVWEDRDTAFEKAVFQAEELADRPRKLFTFVCVLAILSDLFRTLRTREHGLRLRLLVHCYSLLDQYPHLGAAAVVAEKAAYLLWNVESDTELCCRVLEDPRLIHHPIPSRLFSARAAYQHTGGNHELAMAELTVAEMLAHDKVLSSCIQGMKGSVQIALGELETASETLGQTLHRNQEIPCDLRSNNQALLGKAYGLRSEPSRAIEQYERALTPRYCRLWPDKAAYAALDLKALSPSATLTPGLLPALTQIQRGLLPNHPIESSLREGIQEMVAAATTHSANAILRQNMDPNG